MIERLLAEYGLLGIFIGAGLEGEAAVLTGGVLAQRGIVTLHVAMLAAILGSLIADQLWYFVGRGAGDTRFVRRIAARPAFTRALDLLERYPVPFILGFRFVYGLRVISPIAIGVARVPARLFVPLNIVAAVIWGSLFSWLGFAFGQAIFPLIERLGLDALAVAVALLVAGVVAWRLLRWHRRKLDSPGE